MSSTRWLWRTAGLSAVVSTVVCAAGFAYAVNHIMYPKPGSFDAGVAINEPQTPTKPESGKGQAADAGWGAKEQIRIVAWGDSLTAGTGDLTGRGYVRGVRDKLEAQLGKPVFVYNNFAIPGYRTSDLLGDWEAKPDIAKSMAEADLILLTAGGNDLFLSGQGLFGASGNQPAASPGAGGGTAQGGQAAPDQTPAQAEAQTPGGIQFGEGFNPQAAADRIPEAAKRLGELFDKISRANPDARVLYIGLYHPFLDMDPDRAGAPIVQRWNTEAFNIASRYPNITFVPTYDLFALQGTRFLYTDHFHPNQQGYERIAERITDILQ
ncbi:Lysophospholipase L1 [Paenibacillus sp. UNCCL117]|uniref:GDSL-type esterase/lipase family protein n=1 Tax=unclassified Paenibacillus TaxID=185978 RepID=UPI00088E6E48|nr:MULTISPECIES: GDSL-type esterase/lipase family protein [unclassified Paenibacillus]SDC42541.1 Lysophospholipase L1 [Paenibacillus sp. cl123]SFW13208.1 Lysophospholipase L1 [Paenibacillus sp. UNCCL117]